MLGMVDSLILNPSDVDPPEVLDVMYSHDSIDITDDTIDVDIYVELFDELSGLSNSIGLQVCQPNGSGFGTNGTRISGDQNRAVFKWTYTFDKNNADGEYRFKILAPDRSSNFLVQDLHDFGYQLFVRNDSSDANAPILLDFTASNTVVSVAEGNDSIVFRTAVRDSARYIERVGVALIKEGSNGGPFMEMPLVLGSNTDGIYEVTWIFDQSYTEGFYNVSVSLQDNFQNSDNLSRSRLAALGFPSTIEVIDVPFAVINENSTLFLSSPLTGLIHSNVSGECHKTTVNDLGEWSTHLENCSDVGHGDFSISNSNFLMDQNHSKLILTSNNGSCWTLEITNIGEFSSNGITCPTTASIQLESTDLFFQNRNKGLILKSPDNKCWQVALNFFDILSAESIRCND